MSIQGREDGPLSRALGFAIVLLSLAWVTGLHRHAGLVLYAEQPLAAVLGLTTAAGWFLALGRRRGGQVIAALLALGSLVLFGWLAGSYHWASIAIMFRPTWLAVLMGLALVAILFLIWRLVGVAIAIILAVFIAIALGGEWTGIPPTAVDRLALYLMIDPNGVLGIPMQVATEIVIPFVFFGRLLQVSGGGAWFTELAEAAFGRFRGGAAKMSITASALFGSVNGNAVSNVVGTGVVTIPLMKRTGFPAKIAGAVEAVASTGGQMLPPVMGSAAFVMADLLRVPYGTILAAALLPALLYFISVFISVDLIAARHGIAGVKSEGKSFFQVMRNGGHFVVPFAVLLVAFLYMQARPEIAALSAIGTIIVLCMLRPYKGERLTFKHVFKAAVDAGVSVAPVLLVCAGAGLLMGLLNVTGTGFSLASGAIALSGGNVLLLLVLVALAAIVLGMGMPTVAVYIMLATVLAPALTEMGISEIPAHLFIFYFGMLSMTTPPIALASITAGNIANTNIWETSFAGVKLSWIAYIVPFLFVFSPSLTLAGSWYAILVAAITAVVGVYAVNVAIHGDSHARLGVLGRFAWGIGGILLVLPPGITSWALTANVVGGVAVLILALLQRSSVQRSRSAVEG